MFTRAKEQQAETMVSEIIAMRNDVTPENAHEIRVRFDMRKWVASKLKPRVYGDRPPDLNVNTSTNIVVLSEERTRELQERLKRLRADDAQQQGNT